MPCPRQENSKHFEILTRLFSLCIVHCGDTTYRDWSTEENEYCTAIRDSRPATQTPCCCSQLPDSIHRIIVLQYQVVNKHATAIDIGEKGGINNLHMSNFCILEAKNLRGKTHVLVDVNLDETVSDLYDRVSLLETTQTGKWKLMLVTPSMRTLRPSEDTSGYETMEPRLIKSIDSMSFLIWERVTQPASPSSFNTS